MKKQKNKVMKVAIIFFAIVILLLLPQTKALAATYYLDANNGNDANPGTSEQPWKTLNRAYALYGGAGTKVTEGDTVLFRNGDYGKFREAAETEAQLRYRNDWITYKADSGHTPTLTNIIVANQDKWGEIEHGRSYLIFDGFNISDGIVLKHTSYIQIRNCNITRTPMPYGGFYAPYFAGDAIGINATVTHHGTIENCVFSYLTRGIRVGAYGGDYWTIRNNTIHHYAEDAIRPEGASHLLIEGNLIYDTNPYRTGFGLEGTGSGTFEVGETVIQAGSNAEGVVYQLFTTNKIGVYNTSETTFKTAANGGGTVTGQTSGATMSNISKTDYSHSDAIQIEGSAVVSDLVIRGNVMNPGMSNCLMIALYGNGTDVTIENNLAWGQAGNDMQIGGVTNGLSINNNTFVDGIRLTHGYSDTNSPVDTFYNNILSYLTISADSGGKTIRVASHGNNIFGSNSTGAGGPTYPFSLNSTEAVTSNFNALFTNTTSNNYTLVSGSPAINFGNPNYSPSIDILGNSRDAFPDAGAYEYISSTPPPPPPPPPPPILYGDVSEDGSITVYDAALITQATVGLITLTAEQITKGDVSGDGKVSAYDSALIAQRVVGLISKFPVE